MLRTIDIYPATAQESTQLSFVNLLELCLVQPGAMSFDGNNVTDFLKDWDMECEEYGLTDVQKCKKLPRYCNKDIGEAIQMLQGYVNEDWTVLQQELKQLFWRTDPPKETTAALLKL